MVAAVTCLCHVPHHSPLCLQMQQQTSQCKPAFHMAPPGCLTGKGGVLAQVLETDWIQKIDLELRICHAVWISVGKFLVHLQYQQCLLYEVLIFIFISILYIYLLSRYIYLCTCMFHQWVHQWVLLKFCNDHSQFGTDGIKVGQGPINLSP